MRESIDGLKKLAFSAAIIQAGLKEGNGFDQQKWDSPLLTINGEGVIKAWVLNDQEEKVPLFEKKTARFGLLAFGFACDHFKMNHPNYWNVLKKEAEKMGQEIVILKPKFFDFNETRGFSEKNIERITAPALVALCEKIEHTPVWVMQKLSSIEKGYTSDSSEFNYQKAQNRPGSSP